MVRSVHEVVMCTEMHIMYHVTIGAKLWFYGTDWSCMWWINEILLYIYSVKCWVLPFNNVYHKRVLYFFEDLSLYENITLGLCIKLWNYYNNIEIHTPAKLLLLFVGIIWILQCQWHELLIPFLMEVALLVHKLKRRGTQWTCIISLLIYV
jgi:hypothetical protein